MSEDGGGGADEVGPTGVLGDDWDDPWVRAEFNAVLGFWFDSGWLRDYLLEGRSIEAASQDLAEIVHRRR